MVLQNTEGQPDSIVQDIENMVRSYIEKVVFIQVPKFLIGNSIIWLFLSLPKIIWYNFYNINLLC